MNPLDSIIGMMRRLRAGAHQDAVRDWLMLLIVSSITLAGIIIWNVWAFDTVANGGTIGTPVTATPQLFNSASLNAIHTIFANRAAEEVKYVTGTYRYADPSQ